MAVVAVDLGFKPKARVCVQDHGGGDDDEEDEGNESGHRSHGWKTGNVNHKMQKFIERNSEVIIRGDIQLYRTLLSENVNDWYDSLKCGFFTGRTRVFSQNVGKKGCWKFDSVSSFSLHFSIKIFIFIQISAHAKKVKVRKVFEVFPEGPGDRIHYIMAVGQLKSDWENKRQVVGWPVINVRKRRFWFDGWSDESSEKELKLCMIGIKFLFLVVPPTVSWLWWLPMNLHILHTHCTHTQFTRSFTNCPSLPKTVETFRLTVSQHFLKHLFCHSSTIFTAQITKFYGFNQKKTKEFSSHDSIPHIFRKVVWFFWQVDRSLCFLSLYKTKSTGVTSKWSYICKTDKSLGKGLIRRRYFKHRIGNWKWKRHGELEANHFQRGIFDKLRSRDIINFWKHSFCMIPLPSSDLSIPGISSNH